MRNLITILFLIHNTILSAQPGFNQTYDLEAKGCGFMNALIKNDVLYILSGIRELGTPWGLALVVADTNGIILNKFPYYDPEGETILLGDNYDLKLLNDGRIALLGGGGTETYLIIFNNDGTIDLEEKILYDNITDCVTYELEEYKDGFLIGGAIADTNSRAQAFLTRTDSEGNVLWMKRYGVPGFTENSRCMKVIDENTIVLGCSLGSTTLTDVFGQMRILVIDSLGIIKREWQSEKGRTAISDIIKLENGDWLFTESNYTKYVQTNGSDSILAHCNVIRTDSNFNTIWRQRTSPTRWAYNSINDLIPSPDGHWILSEHVALTGPDFSWTGSGGQGGCLTKITSDGEILWQYCDTVHWNIPGAIHEEAAGGHVVLPSGSSILIGRSNRYQPSPGRSFGWLYKVDANGCAMEPCSVSTTEPEAERVLRVYPNPAHTNLQVLIETPAAGRIRVFNSLGRLEREYSVPAGSTLYTLDCSAWPSGMYFVQVEQSGTLQFTERIFVQH